jgi:hypothetical protein
VEIKCLVACWDDHHNSMLFPVLISCDEESWRDESYLDAARQCAADAGYMSRRGYGYMGCEGAVVYDQFSSPTWLFEQFRWSEVARVGVGKTTEF